jgi:hypothetical protein
LRRGDTVTAEAGTYVPSISGVTEKEEHSPTTFACMPRHWHWTANHDHVVAVGLRTEYDYSEF